MEWRVKAQYGAPGYGKPTLENLDRWIARFEKSMQPGGVNAHLGYDPVLYAKVVDQRTGEVLVEWRRSEQRQESAFQVL
jgi:hypothetical protein